MKCSSMVSAILFRTNRLYSFVRVAQKGYRPVIFRRRRVFPGLQYHDDLRFPPYCWDFVLSEAVVKHCKQPLVSIGPKIL